MHSRTLRLHSTEQGGVYRFTRHDVGVEHHECQPPLAFQRRLAIKVEEDLFPPLFEPEITWTLGHWRTLPAIET